MDIKLFTDLIDALAKVTNGIKTIANFPKSVREEMRTTLSETYRLIDTTLNMVIIRLGDILQNADELKMLDETTRLNNFNEWLNAEREFRLCISLRVALRETENFMQKLTDAVCIKNCDKMYQIMNSILATEGEVAMFISGKFQELSNEAMAASGDAQKIQSIRKSVSAFREALIKERLQLINGEITLLSVI